MAKQARPPKHVQPPPGMTDEAFMDLRNKSLLDPACLLASPRQRQAMGEVFNYQPGRDETGRPLPNPYAGPQREFANARADLTNIATQLACALIAKGGAPYGRMTGIQRATCLSEAWAILNAASIFTLDRLAARDMSPEEAEEILAAGETTGEGEIEAPDGQQSLALVPDAGPRKVFDASGKVVEEEEVGGAEPSDTPPLALVPDAEETADAPK